MFEHEGRRFTLVAVVAMARNRVIGREGAMPWRLRADLKHYRRLTMGRPMIMGRKTLDSIGRVLDGRDTIVLTRAGQVDLPGAIVAATPADALRAAAECADRRGTDEIVIAGGAEIYALFLDRIDRVEQTIVEAEPDGDALFPVLDAGEWSGSDETAMERSDGDTSEARFVTLRRTRASG